MTTLTSTVSAETLPAIIWHSARVITTELLSRLYGTEEKNIQQNYSRNSERFVEGTHFFKLEGEMLRQFKKQQTLSKMVSRARSLILWTERGAARHAKMLETDAAWEVFEKLEDCYFRVKETLNAFSRNAGDVLSLEQADLLRNALTAHCARLPKDQQGQFLKKGWSKLKSHFKVSYRQIPQEQLTEALSIITRHAADWEVVEDVPAVAGPALDAGAKANIEGLCSHMEFLRSWFARVYPGLHALSPRLAAAAHDHFVDGVCFARNVVHEHGLKSVKEYAASYPWDGGIHDRLDYNRSFT